MYTPYGFHSMSKQCRVEAQRDARRRQEAITQANRQVNRGRSRADFAWGGTLSSLPCAAKSARQTAGRSEEPR